MKYLIIGLGIYGSNLARDLTALGHEVVGVDSCHNNVENIKDYISTVYETDTTEESALQVLPLKNVDLVIVAIGENFGASIKTVALLKKAGVAHIYARAIDELHAAILESFDLDRILTPEQRAASDLTHEMELGADVETLQVDEDNVVVKLNAPARLLGMPYKLLDESNTYGLRVVAATRPTEARNVLGMKRMRPELLDLSAALEGDESLKVERGDVLTVFGSKGAFRDFYRHLDRPV
ncbi:MAG: TrkA family potassium uptake protein [Muribaculaceae bacterium]|nr:TrkA family potassium uptake protein [Muribaculaceae bacterium]